MELLSLHKGTVQEIVLQAVLEQMVHELEAE
jgi:hypothetical protein